jgi:hypothetical protein
LSQTRSQFYCVFFCRGVLLGALEALPSSTDCCCQSLPVVEVRDQVILLLGACWNFVVPFSLDHDYLNHGLECLSTTGLHLHQVLVSHLLSMKFAATTIGL